MSKVAELAYEYDCEACQDTGDVKVKVKGRRESGDITFRHDYYDVQTCEECCEHQELDHGFCLDCGKDCEDLWINRSFGDREGE